MPELVHDWRQHAQDRTPYIQLEVNGTLLSRYHWSKIDSIKVEQVIDGANKLQLSASAWDFLHNRFSFIGEKVFLPGQSLVLRAGWGPGRMRNMGRFFLTQGNPGYYPEGVRYNVEAAYDMIHFLAQDTDARVYETGTEFYDVAIDIASGYNLLLDYDEPAPGNYITDDTLWKKRGEHDYMWLKMLAARQDFMPPWVEYDEISKSDTIFFKRGSLAYFAKKDGRPHQVFAYHDVRPGDTPVRQCEISFDIAGLPTAVETLYYDPSLPSGEKIGLMAVGIDPEIGQPKVLWSGIASADYLEELSGKGHLYKYAVMTSRSTAHGLDDEAEFKLAHSGLTYRSQKHKVYRLVDKQRLPTYSDAVSKAFRYFQKYMDNYIFAEMVVNGDPYLTSHQIHELHGFGFEYDGLYQIEVAEHNIWPLPYTTKLILHKVVQLDNQMDTVR